MRVNNLLKVITRRKSAPPGFVPATYRSRNRQANYSATVPHNSLLLHCNSHRRQRVQNCFVCVAKPIIHWLSRPIRQRVTFKLAGLVHRSLHETSPIPSHISCTLQYDHFDPLQITFLHAYPRFRTTFASRDCRSTGRDDEFGTLSQMISNLLPLSPR